MASAVTKNDEGSWDLVCPRTSGCAPFVSTRWPTKASAQARLDEHLAEHDERKPMSTLEDFRAAHGLEVDAFGRARVKS